MTNDTELLRQYAFEGSESAFSELVHRHVGLVYSAALREMAGDAALAQDLTQTVFLELSRKASNLCRHPALAGWLYTCVRCSAANLRRTEARRQKREHHLYVMNQSLQSGSAASPWTEIAPVLDDAMHELNENDRAVVVLRFFEQRTIEEVAQVLGLNKSAAHMRIDRALERLRRLLCARGISSTGSALAAALAIGATASAPQGLAATVVTGVFSTKVSCGSTALLTKLLTMTKLQTGIVGALILASAATPVAVQHKAKTRVSQENQSLREELERYAPLAQDNLQLSNEVALLHEQIRTNQLVLEEQSELLRLRSQVTQLRRENKSQSEALAASVRATAELKDTNAVLIAQRHAVKEKPSQILFDAAVTPHLMHLVNGQWQETDLADLNDTNAVLSAREQLNAFMKAREAAESAGQAQQSGESRQIVFDESGKPHMTQLVNGEWQEIAISENVVTIQEGALAFRPQWAQKVPYADQIRYSTNAPAADVKAKISGSFH